MQFSLSLPDENKPEGLRSLVLPSKVTSAIVAYRAARGERALFSPCGQPSMVGQGEVLALSGPPQQIAQLAQRYGVQHARFLGGFAFDGSQPLDGPWQGVPIGRFVCPRLLWISGPEPTVVVVARAHETRAELEAEASAFEARAAQLESTAIESTSALLHDPESAREAWIALVARARQAIIAGELEKVVPARALLAESARPIDPSAVLFALGETVATRFALDLGEGATFLGASPELLVKKHGAEIATEALAGSVPRSGLADETEIAALLGSQKDRDEHGFVLRAIEESLQSYVSQLSVAEERVRSLPSVHHLQRSIVGTLRREAHVLEVAAALHPTPAVCGTPQQAARAWLSEHEPMSRGYYAGAVGWFDTHGDGELRVALRSALVRGNRAWLYAGAGIVLESEAQSELAEVDAKLQSMKRALGVC